MLRKIESLAEFSDRIGFTIVAANGAWPKFAPYVADETSNLNLVFDLMEQALPMVESKLRDTDAFEQIRNKLASARVAYIAGNKREGSLLLLTIDRAINPNGIADYQKRKGLQD